MTQETAIALFEEKEVRKVWDDLREKRFFSIIDVIEVLTESKNPQVYRRVFKKRLLDEGANETVTKCNELKMLATDGKMRTTDCFSTEDLLRIIQSIPSQKAEPFKRWLAKVGYERIEEIENPELAQDRMKQLYEAKGYPQNWIDKRLRGIAIRQNLTDEWKQRGLTEQRDYAILTAEISKATFGMTPNEYRKYKNLPKKSKTNLRDHMTDLELIFTMLGEKVTTEISEQEKPIAMSAHKHVAKRGGKIAGNARKETEKELGRSVVSSKNFIENTNQKFLSTNSK